MGHPFFGGDMSMLPVIIFAFLVIMLMVRILFAGRRNDRWSDERSEARRQRREAKRLRRVARHRHGQIPNPPAEESPPAARPPEVSVPPSVEPVQAAPHPASSTSQAYLNKARAYQAQLNALLKSSPDQNAQARLRALADQVSGWMKAVEELARRVDNFRQNSLIQQDLTSVPQAIEKLETRLAGESDEGTRQDLVRTLASRKNQLAALEQLQSTINRAEIKIEDTVSALGTIYSQVLTAQSTDQVADYSRLAAEVDEEVRTLQDYQAALAEVKLNALS